MQVQWKTKRRYVFFFFLSQRSCSNYPDAHVHAGLELLWSYVFLNTVPYFIFFYCKDPKTLIRLRRCKCKHMLINNFADQMFLGYHFIFHVFFFFFFFFFFVTVLTGLYFTYVYLLQRPSSNYADVYYTELSNTFDTSI